MKSECLDGEFFNLPLAGRGLGVKRLQDAASVQSIGILSTCGWKIHLENGIWIKYEPMVTTRSQESWANLTDSGARNRSVPFEIRNLISSANFRVNFPLNLRIGRCLPRTLPRESECTTRSGLLWPSSTYRPPWTRERLRSSSRTLQWVNQEDRPLRG